MEAILENYLALESGVFLSALVLLLFAIGGVVLGHVADQQKAGKRFFWTESSPPEAELRDFLPKGVEVLHTA
ncbi:MAG: hypothetical protein NEA02_18545 [Thermoanaerobaculia bacterium]|nr:hypothetical protein [Thermoanaerobaculia bacterium]